MELKSTLEFKNEILLSILLVKRVLKQFLVQVVPFVNFIAYAYEPLSSVKFVCL